MAHFSLFGFLGIPSVLEFLILAMVVGVVAVIAVAAVVSSTGRKNRPVEGGKLAPCPDCHGAISQRAQTCPHCGAPVKPTA